MVQREGCRLSVRQQCRALSLHRSNLYYEPQPVSAKNLALMRTCRAIDFAEEQRTGWSFIEARNSVKSLKRVFQELVSAELAAQLEKLVQQFKV